MRRSLSSIQYSLLDQATAGEIKLIRELKANCRKLPVREIPGRSQAEDTWIRVINRLRYLIDTENPVRFLRWGILGTMFVGNPDYIVHELDYLMNNPDWEDRWVNAIEESRIGDPAPFPSYTRSSGNLIHHAYHLSRFEETTAKRVDDLDLIFEFGGGYGSMCRLIHRLGFAGKYVIIDWQEFSYLQSFFLKSIGLPVCSIGSFKTKGRGIATVSDVNTLRDVLSNAAPQLSTSLLIGTWSISEAPIASRTELFDMVSAFNYFLIAYQDKFGEVDNRQFFSSLKCKWRDVNWHEWEIEHIPGNRYLIGERTAT